MVHIHPTGRVAADNDNIVSDIAVIPGLFSEDTFHA
jgi:hypothetical protein